MPESKIITLTMNPAIDKNASVRQVEPNRKLRCQEPSFFPGGGGINVARAVHKLGGEVKAIYPAGGPTGDRLEQLLEKEGISQRRIKTESCMRESLAITEEATNNQYRFEMPGPHLRETEWKNCIEIILKESQTADFLVASGTLPPGVPDDFYAQLAGKTRDAHLKLIVDTSGEPLKKIKGSGLFLLKPNLRELCDLTGRELASEEDQEKAAKELVNDGTCEVLVLSLGAGGVLLVTRDLQERFRSPTVSVKSRIGAGDSTVAGIVLGLTRKMALKEAVMFGIAAGVAAVMTPGTELCRRDDAERIFKSMKEEKKKELV
ncbi:MAG: phosphofructokinase [Candidatus Omnitrophica bacterium CG11_big_fil_rev_8_21_14_0_20_45_26]|uniref:Phosphofructokinase n=1 Tax=Candidatus Abzuiibacterium crystallinum TaxID=1974748 RepID=A0A2H0LR21_9BACT|nr:MAG: phosphofructokinase [Candidatus Omnitrophica bacterium CG11_big_fil_rev_8_21_14_0_20_45_26]PIW65317.1 MAG: phosphofructokinase [Candidatus Omnitrophica bacterium CG12_big_fil_rev_8_21_14_0_65_45_16]